jgi:hypothetical protein
MLSKEAWLAIGALCVAAVLAGSHRSRSAYKWNKELLETGLERPPLWIYVNEGDVNSRWWADFGGRSSRALNIPLYNICYETIANKNGQLYRIEVIRGLSDLALRLGGWAELPLSLRNPLAPVGRAEVDWIRSIVLARWGGVWVSPFEICVKGLPMLPKDTVVAFGTDWTVSNAGRDGTPAPGSRILWSPRPGLRMFTEWERICRQRVEEQGGGRQVRNDFAEDWTRLSTGCTAEGVQVEIWNAAELDRQGAAGRRIDATEWLASGLEGRLPFEIPDCVYFVPIPYDEIILRRNLGWILRMSESQILEADIAIRYIFDKASTA